MVNQPFSAAASAKLIRMRRWAQPRVDAFLEARVAIAKELGEPNADASAYTIPQEKRAEFADRLAPLLAEAVELDSSVELEVADFEGVRVPPSILELSEPFLKGGKI